MKNNSTHTITIVDDHSLFAKSLEGLINMLEGFEVIFHASNGVELQEKMKAGNIPSLILLDLNMPVMNGFETALWLKEYYPDIPFLALTMENDESSILQMIRNGARGYLLKDIYPDDLYLALNEVLEKGFYYSGKVNEVLISVLLGNKKTAEEQTLKDNEISFIKLACTEMTYKEIANEMNLSPKTIDGYRQELFNKLHLKNRIGLVIYAIKNDIYKV